VSFFDDIKDRASGAVDEIRDAASEDESSSSETQSSDDSSRSETDSETTSQSNPAPQRAAEEIVDTFRDAGSTAKNVAEEPATEVAEGAREVAQETTETTSDASEKTEDQADGGTRRGPPSASMSTLKTEPANQPSGDPTTDDAGDGGEESYRERLSDAAGDVRSNVQSQVDKTQDRVLSNTSPTSAMFDQAQRERQIEQLAREGSVSAKVFVGGEVLEDTGVQTTQALDDRVPELEVGPKVGIGTEGEEVGEQLRNVAVEAPAGAGMLASLGPRAAADIGLATEKRLGTTDFDNDEVRTDASEVPGGLERAGGQMAQGIREEPVGFAAEIAAPTVGVKGARTARRAASSDGPTFRTSEFLADDTATAPRRTSDTEATQKTITRDHPDADPSDPTSEEWVQQIIERSNERYGGSSGSTTEADSGFERMEFRIGDETSSGGKPKTARERAEERLPPEEEYPSEQQYREKLDALEERLSEQETEVDQRQEVDADQQQEIDAGQSKTQTQDASATSTGGQPSPFESAVGSVFASTTAALDLDVVASPGSDQETDQETDLDTDQGQDQWFGPGQDQDQGQDQWFDSDQDQDPDQSTGTDTTQDQDTGSDSDTTQDQPIDVLQELDQAQDSRTRQRTRLRTRQEQEGQRRPRLPFDDSPSESRVPSFGADLDDARWSTTIASAEEVGGFFGFADSDEAEINEQTDATLEALDFGTQPDDDWFSGSEDDDLFDGWF
jgi:uncharacterized membrane protein YcgQ (UPF0703/DUF1980 family)